MHLDKFVFLVASVCLFAGCAGQDTLENQQTQIDWQATQLAQQQAMLNSQHIGLEHLQEQQEHIKEMIEVNQVQLAELIEVVKTPPKTTKRSAPKAAKTPAQAAVSEVLAPQKMTLGRVEWVWVDKLGMYLKARLDTGAKSSSIHASNIQYFERDGKDWVRFNMYTHKKTKPADGQAPALFEVPVLRTVKIKQASATTLEKRPVIKMRVRIGPHEADAEFTLTDRKGMLYPVLIGRTFLRDVAVVDVGQVFIHKRLKNDKE